jgi:uncharacterized protein YkvS
MAAKRKKVKTNKSGMHRITILVNTRDWELLSLVVPKHKRSEVVRQFISKKTQKLKDGITNEAI